MWAALLRELPARSSPWSYIDVVPAEDSLRRNDPLSVS